MAFKRKAAAPAESSGPETVIELDKKKQITVRKFNGIKLVDIREFYIDKATGEKKPGKKGISLTEEVWKKLLDVLDEIRRLLDDLGAEPPVPAVPAKKTKVVKAEEIEAESEEE